MRKPGVSPCIMVYSIYKRTDDLCGWKHVVIYTILLYYYVYVRTGGRMRGETRRQAPNDVFGGGGGDGTGSKEPVSRNGWKRSVRWAGAGSARQMARKGDAADLLCRTGYAATTVAAVARTRHFGPAALLGSVPLRRRAVTNNVRCYWQCASLPHNDHSTIVEYISFFYFSTLVINCAAHVAQDQTPSFFGQIWFSENINDSINCFSWDTLRDGYDPETSYFTRWRLKL